MSTQQFVVVGLGRFGMSLGMELIELGYEVMGVDRSEVVVEEVGDRFTYAAVADATDEEMLRSLGIRNFDCGIVAIGENMQTSILAAILLKELGVKKVVAKAITVLHGRALEKIGVDQVIFPERDMGIRVAHQLVTPNLLDYIELSDDYSIVEMRVPSCLNSQTVADLNSRSRFGCTIVALRTEAGVTIAPTALDRMHEGDVMVIAGPNDRIEQFEREVVNVGE